MTKSKLLIIHNRLVIGGPALDTIPLAYHLKEDFDIHILYGCKEKDEIEPSFLLNKYPGLKLVNIPFLKRSPNVIQDVRTYQFIAKYISQFQPDIVHTHGAKVGILGRIAARRAKVRLIVHTFHGHLFHSYFNEIVSSAMVFIERRMVRFTHKIIALSKSQKLELTKALNLKEDSMLEIVPLGVDYIDHSLRDHYHQAFKRTYHTNNNTVNIGLLGRMVPIKNPIFFLKVAQEILIKRQRDHIRFFIVGDGEELRSMKEFLTQNEIEYTEKYDDKAVVFTSWVQNVQSILEGLDMVVLTSFNEGTPLSLIEAQMCGKPVVAVNVGGVSDTLLDGATGFLLPDHDISKFADAVLRLVDDKVLRDKMEVEAVIFASANFSKKEEIDRTRGIYMSHKTL